MAQVQKNISLASLYLASQSPRRAELLRQIGVPFLQFGVDILEQYGIDETPEHYVCRLAKKKAQAGLEYIQRHKMPLKPVLGADTIVVCDQQVLEKPENFQAASKTLSILSGRSHNVMSAVAITDGVSSRVVVATTRVHFRPISAAEIKRYWHTKEPCDKAGAYGIQGLGAVFVSAIEGSYSNVVGLPLETIMPLLAEFQIDYWQ